MPVYFFKCSACEVRVRKILPPGGQKKPQVCACGAVMKRDPSPPSVQVKESLDNGAMPHRVERLADAERLYRERAEGDPRNQR